MVEDIRSPSEGKENKFEFASKQTQLGQSNQWSSTHITNNYVNDISLALICIVFGVAIAWLFGRFGAKYLHHSVDSFWCGDDVSRVVVQQ